jgi:hypothetical protein
MLELFSCYFKKDEIIRVNTGWLLKNETELRLNFHNKPLKIFSKYESENKTSYAIKIRPFKIDEEEHLVAVKDYLHTLRVYCRSKTCCTRGK